MVGGGIFREFAGPAIEVVRVRPGPAVGNGLGLADGGDGGVDVAVWVRIVDDSGLSLSDGGVGGAEVLLLEVESAGAEEDDGSAVVPASLPFRLPLRIPRVLPLSCRL